MRRETPANEKVHEEDDIINCWGPDYRPLSGPKALFGISLALGLMGLAGYGVSFLAPELPAVRREFPFNGLEKELGGTGVRAIEYEDEE
jgi:NADH dehydrogenase (ubiquinone) 1 beta subcomplex subunit 8